jgi:putative transcriptional regulator
MNLTQKELGILAGVSRQAINTIERGKVLPSILLSLRIAEALEMKVDDLFELIKK